MIKIPLHRGCFLLLTPEEYRAGIRRGKAARRRKQFQEREAKRRGADQRRDFVQRGGDPV